MPLLRTLLCFLLASPTYAGVVQGMVAEHATGLPMSRALVRLEPIPGNPAKPLEVRSGRSGRFEFNFVPDGDEHHR